MPLIRRKPQVPRKPIRSSLPRGETSVVWEKVLPAVIAILGMILGSTITLLSTGYVESRKALEQRKAQAVTEFLEACWGGSSESDQWSYTRKISLLSAYAPRSVLEAVRAYHATDCSQSGDSSEECKRLWAKVLREIRPMTHSDDADEELLIELIWGKG